MTPPYNLLPPLPLPAPPQGPEEAATQLVLWQAQQRWEATFGMLPLPVPDKEPENDES